MNFSLRKTKKIMLKYQILKMELEDSKTLYEQYEDMFLDDVVRYIEENNIEIKSNVSNNVEHVASASEPHCDDDLKDSSKDEDKFSKAETKNSLSDEIKKVYKKIVLKIHPDKNLDKSDDIKKEYKDLYSKTQSAATSSDYLEIIKIASDLGIDIPELSDDIVLKINSNLSTIEKSIESYKNKYPWIWYNSEDSEKEIHIKEFLDLNKENLHKIVSHRAKT